MSTRAVAASSNCLNAPVAANRSLINGVIGIDSASPMPFASSVSAFSMVVAGTVSGFASGVGTAACFCSSPSGSSFSCSCLSSLSPDAIPSSALVMTVARSSSPGDSWFLASWCVFAGGVVAPRGGDCFGGFAAAADVSVLNLFAALVGVVGAVVIASVSSMMASFSFLPRVRLGDGGNVVVVVVAEIESEFLGWLLADIDSETVPLTIASVSIASSSGAFVATMAAPEFGADCMAAA
mmetsp:Transcript_28309/g.79547  ORF Transcript_28309/g.79547 Transcript_28309/m.79547 type:complete len:238 (-) Transcript_28309:775-1488(-)